MACLLQVDEFDNKILLNESKLYVIPPQLETIIRTVSVSTARGILYSELRGMYLHNVILPVVYMTSGGEVPKNEDATVKNENTPAI